MTVKTYTMPEQATEYGAYIGKLRDAGSLYHEQISDGEIAVMTGDDMPARDLPASVYLGQLHRALDQLGYRADFDAAMSIVSSGVKSWLESGGELLTNDGNWSLLIRDNRQDQVFRLAAQL